MGAADHWDRRAKHATVNVGRTRAIVAGVMLVSALGFALASSSERGQENATPGLNEPEGSAAREAAERGVTVTTATPTTASTTTVTTSAANAPEGSPAREAAERGQPVPTTTLPPILSSIPAPPTTDLNGSGPPRSPSSSTPTTVVLGSASETLFGIDTESTGATTLAVIILAFAALLAWRARRRWILVLVAAITIVFAALDGREAFHQHQEGRTGLVAAAITLALLHAFAAALCLIAFSTEARGPTRSV